jgi:RNA polymerase sigma factor (sigma-70 family)
MNAAVALGRSAVHDDRRITDAVVALGPRLRSFVRRQVRDLDDAEDIVQDVLTELVGAARMMQPIEHLAGWLFRVARNRIVDRFRALRRHPTNGLVPSESDASADPGRVLEDWLPPVDAGPEAAYARSVLVEELVAALDDLPDVQREAFVLHEIEGRPFRELADATGIPINTLLWRKHAAVRHLRRRLEALHAELSD